MEFSLFLIVIYLFFLSFFFIFIIVAVFIDRPIRYSFFYIHTYNSVVFYNFFSFVFVSVL